MPFVFAYASSSSKKPIATTVDVGGVSYEPAQPSRFSTTCMPKFVSVLSSLWAVVVGLYAVVYSYGYGTYLHLQSGGYYVNKATDLIPFRPINLAFTMDKKIDLDQLIITELTTRRFTSIQYNRRVVYMKDAATRDDLEYVYGLNGVAERSDVPNRYLNPHSFRATLQLFNLLSVIFSATHSVLLGKDEELGEEAKKMVHGAKMPGDWDEDRDVVVTQPKDITIKRGEKDTIPRVDAWENLILMMTAVTPTTYLAGKDVGQIVRRVTKNTCSPSIPSSRAASEIVSHGMLLKFVPALALPDPNVMGNVIGRYFFRALGQDTAEQSENLQELKTGISGLKLTRLGDEIAHMGKCLEISIGMGAGIVPIFTGTTYEGCLVAGGYGGHIDTTNGLWAYQGIDALREDFAHFSSHGSALRTIADLFPAVARDGVRATTSMVGLRRLCLSNAFKQEDIEKIIGAAEDLDFGVSSWVCSPHNLKRAFQIVADGQLTPDIPISRRALFSNDNLLVALSAFGDHSAPSWNIPGGQLQSLKGKAAPVASIVPSDSKGKGKKREARSFTSDAGWVMEVRRVELEVAVTDFRALVKLGGYRSIPSFTAKKQGFFVFESNRMTEFWAEMQAAYRNTDPGFVVNSGEAESSGAKRKGDAADESGKSAGKKKKGMAF